MDTYNPLIEKSWNWLMQRYDLQWDLDDFPVNMTFVSESTASRPRCRILYYEEGKPEKVIIRIVKDRDYWITYKRKTVGIYAPCLQVDVDTAILFQLIHELSHLIEWVQGRGLGDVAPTFNEVMYAYDNHYELFTNCQILTDNRRNHAKNKNFRCIIN